MVRCDIGIAYCDDWTVNCKEKNRVPRNVTNAGQQINNGFLLYGENNSLARANEIPFMA